MVSLPLNEGALALLEVARARLPALRVSERDVTGARVLDLGIESEGGLAAGLLLARLTLADLADVTLVPGEIAEGVPCPHVVVRTDHPAAACMASQYAGWQIAAGKFFAMGSGPFRARYGREEIYDRIGYREEADRVFGALETRRLPDEEVVSLLSRKLGLPPGALTLAVAPTGSLAGSLQVVARSVETALHKLDLLGFDLSRVTSGFGSAPLPPPSPDDLVSIGRTNDAVLYGARVHLWVRGDDDSIVASGERVPSSTSRDHGEPFLRTFERHGRDFYKLDPGLFSPAEVILHAESGRTWRFGEMRPDVLRASFLGDGA